MMAAGVQHEPFEMPGGFGLAMTLDVLWLVASSHGAGDRLTVMSSEVSRLRLALEGIWYRAITGAGTLGTRLKLGMRYDGGVAENGFRVDFGGRVLWRDPARGLTLGFEGWGLVAHDVSGFRDRGGSVTLGWMSDPVAGRGPSFSLRHDTNRSSSGGTRRVLLSEAPEENGARYGIAARSYLAEAAWGSRPSGAPSLQVRISATACLRREPTTASAGGSPLREGCHPTSPSISGRRRGRAILHSPSRRSSSMSERHGELCQICAKQILGRCRGLGFENGRVSVWVVASRRTQQHKPRETANHVYVTHHITAESGEGPIPGADATGGRQS